MCAQGSDRSTAKLLDHQRCIMGDGDGQGKRMCGSRAEEPSQERDGVARLPGVSPI